MCSIPPDIFGLPNEGIHSYRLFDLAIIDIIATVIIAMLLAKIMDISVIKMILILFIIGQILHYTIGVNTGFMRLLGIKIPQKN
jgi:uncharacterized membrane protein